MTSVSLWFHLTPPMPLQPSESAGPDAGFGFDAEQEAGRLLAVEKHAVQLLSVAEVVGLQEVPAALVERLIEHGTRQHFQVQWVAAPSDYDKEWYDKVAGVLSHAGRGSNEAGVAEPATPRSLPPVAHDMLFARCEVLKTEAVAPSTCKETDDGKSTTVAAVVDLE